MGQQDDLKDRLDAAIQQRDKLASEVQRVTGRLEHAREALAKIEEDARKKGIDPKKIDGTIAQLEAMLKKGVETLERQTEEAAEAMKQFEEGDIDEIDS